MARNLFDDDCTAYHDWLEREQMEKELTMPVGHQEVCRCSAYEWPHRMGYGHCDRVPSKGDGDCTEVCPECGSGNTCFDAQERGGDESPVYFKRCRTCGHEWDHA
jgi:DNA-directed RNA polymerase subunit M/transcription elongation factor TFIIS